MKNTLILSALALGIASIITGCCCSGSNQQPQDEEVAMETIQIIPCPVCTKQMQQDRQQSRHPHIAACTSGNCENSAEKQNSTGTAAGKQ